MIRDFPEYERDWFLCFGGNHAGAEEDILELLPRVANPPQMYQYCGTDDFLAEGNRKFCQLCSKLNFPLTSLWEEKGVHGWPYWDPQVLPLLKWIAE